MPVVSIRSAVCVLGGFPALAGADLDVLEGEIVLLAGPNGAGKSTLLRLVAGLVPLRAGTATVLGHDLTRDRTAHRRHLALVGHETFCYDDLSLGENVTFSVRAAGAGIEGVGAALDRLGLAALRDVPYQKLSAGQRRRCAMAVALARRPALWLLDEPHAGLDDQARDALDTLIREVSSAGHSVVIASHELERVTPLATRVARVVGGRVYGGPVDEKAAPRDHSEPIDAASPSGALG